VEFRKVADISGVRRSRGSEQSTVSFSSAIGSERPHTEAARLEPQVTQTRRR